MINNFIKSAFINIKRNKKNRILINLFTLLWLLLFFDTIIIKNFYSYYDYAINKNIGFRTLSVYHPTMSYKDAITEIKKVKHVSEVYEGIYSDTSAQSNIKDKGANGYLGLVYGTKNTAPPSIIGKNIDELIPGEIICPYEFYPDSNYGNPLDIDEDRFLSPEESLNRNIVLTYYKNKSTIVENKVVEETETLTKNLKIVGLYDETTFRNGINVCISTPKDIKDIVDAYNPPIKDFNSSPLHIVVDEEKNIKEVRKNIQNLNNYTIEKNTISYLDKSFVYTLFSVTIIIAVTIIVAILFTTKNYINKKIKNDFNTLGILRACGYTKNQIILKEITENTIIVTISFAISISIFSLIFTILNNNIFKYFKYIGFNINSNIFILFIDSILIIIFLELINYLLIKKALNNPITAILKEE